MSTSEPDVVEKATRRVWLAYGLAIAAVAVGALVRSSLDPILRTTSPLIFFYPAVMLAAAAGGLGPGLFATALGAVVGMTLFASRWFLDDQALAHGVRLLAFLGTGLFISITCHVLQRARGQLHRNFLIAREAQRVSHVNEMRFSSIFNHAGVGICLATPEGHMKMVNQKLCDMLGYSAEELVQLTYEQITYPPDWPPQTAQASRLVAGEIDTYAMEKRYVRKGGSLVWGELTCSIIRGEEPYVVAVIQDISARKQAEAGLRESEEKFRTLAENARVAIGMVQGERFIYANRYFSELSGYSRDELLQMDFPQLVHPSFEPMMRERARRRQAGEQVPNHYEFMMVTRSGEARWVDFSPAVLMLQGRPVIIGTGYDVTERKRAETALNDSQKHLRLITNAVPALIAYIDAGFYYRSANRAYQEWFGKHPDQITGHHASEVLGPTLWPRVHPLMQRALAGEAVAYDGEADFAERGKRWVHANYIPDRDEVEVGKVRGFVALVTDISEAKYAEQALRQNEAFLRRVIDTAPSMIFAKDWEGRFVLCNQAIADLYGTTVEQVIGKTDADFNSNAEEVARFQRDDRLVMSTRQERLLTEPVTDAQGQVRWFSTVKVPLFNPDGTCDKMLGIATDITARKLAEEARTASEERFRQLIVKSHDSITILSADGIIQQAFPGVTEVLGYAPEELIGRDAINCELMHPDDKPVIREVFEQLRRQPGATIFAQHRYRHKDGTWRWLEGWGKNLLDNPAVHGIVANSRDVTARKEAEEALRRSEARLAEAKQAAESASQAKDHFLAVLSHELRTPLTPVLAAAASLESDQRIAPSIREDLSMIHRNVALEARLIDDLLDLNRIARGKLELKRSLVAAHKVLEHTVQMLANDARAKELELTLECDGGSNLLKADPPRLQQVFWNLISNAIKFTPSGGWIRVHCATDEARREIIVEVADSGIGIEADRDRLFDAFQQGSRLVTRRFGGLGLGLSIAKTVVELHGGRISVHSEGRNKGSRFLVHLPLAQAESPKTPVPEDSTSPPAVESPSTRHRILLVEDHADTSRIIARLLRASGFEVRTASSVADASQVAKDGDFDLLISDLGLPDGSGIDVLRELRERGPIRAIALSGYGMDDDIARSRNAGFTEHLTKPVDIERLQAAIATALTANT